MTDKDILGKLKSILVDKLKVKAAIEENTALLGDEILDSLDFINYTVTIEQEFGIRIKEDDIADQKLGVIANMIRYIARQKGE
jgi:acyl carrier protein